VNGGVPYTITIGGATGGTFDPGNYNISYATGGLTVNKATLTVIADDKSKTYGDPDPALTYTVDGLLVNDQPDVVTGVSLNTVTGAAATFGNHTITANGGVADNYNIIDQNGTLTVNAASLIITADPQSKIFGQTFVFQGTEFVPTGLKYSDTVASVGLSSLGTPATATPGNYPITETPNSATGTGLSNYTITFVPGVFFVEPGIIGQPSIPGTLRADYDQLIGGMYDDDYGVHRYYELEVPGHISRVVPKPFGGIGSGSSLVNTTIGMDTVYHVDRFQPFRH
jgi:hypothetical protein